MVLMARIKADPLAQQAAADANTVAAIAKEAGFSISADDLTNAQSELSDQELEGVAGGGFGFGLDLPGFEKDLPGFRDDGRIGRWENR